jgi:predicted PurR-regulated permease PerM
MVIGVLGVISLMLTFATRQVIDGSDELAGQVVDGLDQIEDWLKDGPLNASDQQIEDAIQGMQDLVTTGNAEIVSTVTEVGTVIGHVVAGFFIVLFATYFFLADGRAIWAWVVLMFPRAARTRADSSGKVAWASLTQFVRATVLVALVDAAGIALVAAILDVPFVAAIGVLVFLGAFVPMVGATVSGAIAVLVALVAHGPLVALIMLGGVIAVQQIEAHVLQPFLMGRFVSVHPLGVILAIAVGVIVAGIPGALVAVPLAAAVNAVVLHLAESGPPGPEAEPGQSEPGRAAPGEA